MRSGSLNGVLYRLTGDGDLGHVLRGAGTTFAIRVVATLIAYVSILALARWMGASEYGAFAYAFAWVYLLALPAGLGMPLAIVRFLPEYAVAGNWAGVRGIVGRGAWLTVITSAVIALAGIGVVLALGDRVPQPYLVPLLIALAGLPVMALVSFVAQVSRASGWVGMAYAPPQIWYPLLVLLTAGALVLAGVPLVAQLMVPVALVLAAICLLAQAAVLTRRLGPRIRGIAPAHDQRAWLRVSVPLLLFDGFAALISHSDVLMVGAFIDPAAVAHYFAAVRTATLVTFFFASVGALAAPRMSELYAQGRVRELQELLSGIAPWIAVPATLVMLIVAGAGSLLLNLFGEGFEVAWPALVLLAAGNLVTSIAGPAAQLLNMTGHQDFCARVYGAAAAANIALNAILIPRLGLTGAALSTALSVSAMSLVLVLIARRKLGLKTSVLALRRGWRSGSP